jgi:hypothetical protein
MASYRINIVCECGRALGRAMVDDGVVEFKPRGGQAESDGTTAVLRCKRSGREHADLSLTVAAFHDRLRKAAEYGRKELTVGVDL